MNDVESGEAVFATGVDLDDVLGKLVAGLLGVEGALRVINVPERHVES